MKLIKIYDEKVQNALTQLEEMIEDRLETCKIKFSYYADKPYFESRAKDEDSLLGELYAEKVRIIACSIPVTYCFEV